MKQLVRVQKCNDDGTAQVIRTRASVCFEDCRECSGCGVGRQDMILIADNPIGAGPGQVVTLRRKPGPVLTAAAVRYLMPLGLFLIGYLVCELAWMQGPLGGVLAFVPGIILAEIYGFRMAEKRKTGYTITGFGYTALNDPEKRG